jgi:hypothetical protein
VAVVVELGLAMDLVVALAEAEGMMLVLEVLALLDKVLLVAMDLMALELLVEVAVLVR